MARARHNLFGHHPPPCLGEGPKGQISLNFNYKVNFKDFKPNSVCLLTNERYNTYKTRFAFGRSGLHGWDLGLLGEGSNITFSEQGHVAYQIKGDDQ